MGEDITSNADHVLGALQESRMCCRAMSAACLACSQGMSVKEFCKKSPGKYGCPKPEQRRRRRRPTICCKAMTSSCLACKQGVSVKEFCKKSPGKYGCPKPEQRRRRRRPTI